MDSSALASAAGERAFPAGHKAGGQGPGSPRPREGARSCSVHCVRDGAVTKARDPQGRAERAEPAGPSLRDPERSRGAAGKGGARAKVHRGPGMAGGARWGWGRRWGWGMPAWMARRLAARRMDRGGREGGDASPGSPFPALSSTMRPDPRHKHAPRHPGAPLPPFGEKIKSNKIQYGSLAGTSGDGERAAAPGLPARPAGQPHAGRPRRAAAAAPGPDPTAAGEGAAHTRERTHTHKWHGRRGKFPAASTK